MFTALRSFHSAGIARCAKAKVKMCASRWTTRVCAIAGLAHLRRRTRFLLHKKADYSADEPDHECEALSAKDAVGATANERSAVTYRQRIHQRGRGWRLLKPVELRADDHGVSGTVQHPRDAHRGLAC